MMTNKQLTRKQQAFVSALVDNPKSNGTQAALVAYNTSSPVVAASIAYENLRKPQILLALKEHSALFESVVVGTALEWGNSEEVRKRELALKASFWGFEQLHGKSIAKIEQSSSVLRVNIDLSGSNQEPPAEMLN